MAPRAKSVNRIPDGIPEEFQDRRKTAFGGGPAKRRLVATTVPRKVVGKKSFLSWIF